MAKVRDFLSDKITPEDMGTLEKLIGGEDAPDATMAGDAAYRSKLRHQHRRAILNQSEFELLYMRPQPRPRTAADEARFREMFPNMDRLKFL